MHSLISFVAGQDYFRKVYFFQRPSSYKLDFEALPDGKTALLGGMLLPDSTAQSTLLLLDAKGEIIWSKILITGASSYGSALTLTPDGNLLVGLNAADSTGIPYSAVLKMSIVSGAILWESQIVLPVDTQIGTKTVRIIPLTDGGCAGLAHHRLV